MEHYSIKGMSCAACSARVEKAVSGVAGVTECSVNLLTNSMTVEGTADSKAIEKAVCNAGYGIKKKGAEKSESDESDSDGEIKQLKKRLIWSVVFLVILMYFSMGHMMWGFPLPSWFDGNHIAMGLVQLILAGIIMVINQKFFISGFKALANRAPNMDTLVALGSAASYIWSVYALFAMSGAQVSGDMQAVMKYMDEFYFESAGMILTLITVGKMLEARSKGKTTDALRALMNLAPQSAVLFRDGKEIKVPIGEVKKDDIFVVRPGESIPVDGVITEGSTAVNESALTGESIPRDAAAGDTAVSGFINLTGTVEIEAAATFEDSTVSSILKLIEENTDKKSHAEKFITKFAKYYTPAVVLGAVLIAAITPFVTDLNLSESITRALSFLVVSCPCALLISVPVAFFGGIGAAAKHGVLIQGSNMIEALAKADKAMFDKTGTLTDGTFHVSRIHSEHLSENELLKLAAYAEYNSTHPISVFIKKESGIEIDAGRISSSEEMSGYGVCTVIDGKRVLVGNQKLMKKESITCAAVETGCVLHVASDGVYEGYIVISDRIRPEAPKAIRKLHEIGVSKTVMLTGDTESAAEKVAKAAGIDEFKANLLPNDKSAEVEKALSGNPLIFVGDGINDAPSIARADIGVSMGGLGSDAAISASDVVLMNDRLESLPKTILLSRKTIRIAKENIVLSLFVKFAVMILCGFFGADLWYAIFADVGVCILAVLNALRTLKLKF